MPKRISAVKRIPEAASKSERKRCARGSSRATRLCPFGGGLCFQTGAHRITIIFEQFGERGARGLLVLHFGKGHAVDCEKKIKKRGLEKSEPLRI